MPSYASPEVCLYIDTPDVIFRARLNMPGTISYPVSSLIFDGVTLGDYSDILTDQTLLLGTTEGADDLGRARVQALPTSTTIPVGRVSQGVEDGSLTIVDNAYVSVLKDWRVWSKLPYQDPNGQDFKDSTTPVDDHLTAIPPVSNCGPPAAGTVDSGTGLLTVTLPDGGVNLSYAMAEGASIASYVWGVGAGTITVGTIASPVITATFPAGRHWVTHTVVDSNGKEHESHCVIVAVDPNADITIQKFDVESHRLTQQGSSLRLRIFDDLPRTTVLDGAFVLYWHGEPSSPSDRSNIKFFGWIQNENANISATRTGLSRGTALECVDVAGRLDSLPGFPQALQREDEDDVDEMWSLMPDLDINKALHYLIFWHSTALGLADFFLPEDGDEYPSMRLDSTGATLYDQIHSRALSMTPDHILTCNAQGQLSVMEDWMLVDVGSRPTAAPILTEDDYSDISMPYARPPRVHVLRSSAVVCSTDWIMLGGEKTLPLAFSIAPGEAFGQGIGEATEAEGLTQSQTQLNVVTGHRYARLNARFGPVRVRLLNPVGVWDFVPALMNRIQLNIGAEYAAQRGLPFTQVNAMCKELVVNYRNGKTGTAIEADATLELETSGVPAVTHVPETEGDPDDYETPPIPPPTVPPEMGLEDGVQMVAGIGLDGYVYKTSDFQTASGSGGPTWTRTNLTIAATIYSWVVDPFSPGYIDGAGTINGWIVNDTNIYRVTDLFGSPTKTSVFTFPTVTVGASFHWRSIQASFGAYFGPGANPWLICVSYYGNAVGHTGTWVTYSTDGGVTWSAEVQISALYDSAAAVRFNPIGVYASPKTPGLAYAVAHVNMSSGELPRWGTSTGVGNFAVGPTSNAHAIQTSYSAPPTGNASLSLVVGPPTDAVRVKVAGEWTSSLDSVPDGAFVAGGGNMSLDDGGSAITTTINTLIYTAPAGPDGFSAGSFEMEFVRAAGTEWPGFSTTITPVSIDGTRVEIRPSAQASGGTVLNTMSLSMRVTEIEMEGGAIYNPSASACALFKTVDWGATWTQVTGFIEPGDGMAGSIHLPWILNAAENLALYGHYDDAAFHQFRLKKSDAGVISDISPAASGVSYGVHSYGFGIRAYDNDRQFLALGGFGNDTTASTAGDLAGLWVSSNAGAAWVNILAPAAVANAPRGLQIAFGGSSEQILFAWGGKSDGTLASIYYSSDLGATLDSREGNLNSLATVTLIGIAGGVS